MSPLRPGAITLTGLAAGYDGRPVITGITGLFAPGSLTAIVGPNGGGKSTLLKSIAGILRPLAGTIGRGGLRTDSFGYLPQGAAIDRSFPIDVAGCVLFGAWRRLGLFRGVDAATADRARQALADVGLAGMERRPVASLSAGQFQRVLFARLLLQDAPVILLDEPFNAVDARTTADLLALLRRWHGQGRTVIAVLHDLDQVADAFPQTLVLDHAVAAWGPTAAALAGTVMGRPRFATSRLPAWEARPAA